MSPRQESMGNKTGLESMFEVMLFPFFIFPFLFESKKK